MPLPNKCFRRLNVISKGAFNRVVAVYADSFHCTEFVIPNVFNQNVFVYSCIFCM